MSAHEVPGSEGQEGHVDEDRQDPPLPGKTEAPEGDDDRDLDGFTATPGDTDEDRDTESGQ